jgi:hypothetical protein
MKIKKLTYLLLLVLWPLLVSAQEDFWNDFEQQSDYYDKELAVKRFDDDKWEAAKEGIDYRPAAIKEKKKKEEEQANSNNNNGANRPNRPRRTRDYSGWDWNIGDGSMSGFFKILLIIVLIVLIAGIVFRLAGGSFDGGASKEKDKVPVGPVTNADIHRVEQNLHKSDMEILIDNTLSEGNYMMVTRLYYLWAIKELSNKRLIKWKRDKTNRDYLRELRKTDLHKPFREVTRIFEEVWYGNRAELGKEPFQAIEGKLKSFVNQVKGK